MSTALILLDMKFFAVPAIVLGLGASALASPGVSWMSRLLARATTDPTVLNPNTGAIWNANEIYNVTWDTSGLEPPTCGDVLDTALYLAQGGAIPNDGSVGSASKAYRQFGYTSDLTPTSATYCSELFAQPGIR